MIDCVFCDKAKAEYRLPGDIMVFEPLNPVVPGHLLVVPVEHINDFTSYDHDFMFSPYVSTMRRASTIARELRIEDKGLDFNLITSAGQFATQTVFHFHIHLVPRRMGDGLTLPWTGQNK